MRPLKENVDHYGTKQGDHGEEGMSGVGSGGGGNGGVPRDHVRGPVVKVGSNMVAWAAALCHMGPQTTSNSRLEYVLRRLFRPGTDDLQLTDLQKFRG